MDNVLFLGTYALETHTLHTHTQYFDTSPNKCVESLNGNDVFNAKPSIKILLKLTVSFTIETAAATVISPWHKNAHMSLHTLL